MHPLESIKKVFLASIFLIIAACASVFFLTSIHVPASVSTASSTVDYSPELLQIGAKAFYAYDINEKKVLFAKDEHESLPLASIAKLMTALVISENLPASTTITVNQADVAKRYDAGDIDLRWGEKWSLKDLLDYSLITSSNDGIAAIVRTLDANLASTTTTIDLMNAEAKKLGLADTLFINTTGLDVDSRLAGAYSSARDTAMLLETILMHDEDLLSETTKISATFISASGIMHKAMNTDTLLGTIPGTIASKTGLTDLAGGNLAVIFDAGVNHPIAVVVLGSSEEGRFVDTEKLVDLSLQKISGSSY
jgi:D-alanyl-D-alanine carboxypeptidase (penicillin-binding protein 5/6)